jgi:hypothetical protein
MCTFIMHEQLYAQKISNLTFQHIKVTHNTQTINDMQQQKP